MPHFITALAVTGIDGRIAISDSDKIAWSSVEDKQQLHTYLNTQVDICILGRKSFNLAHAELKGPYKIWVLSRTLGQPKGDQVRVIDPDSLKAPEFWAPYAGQRLAVLGGGMVYAYFLENHWLDEIRLTLEPYVLGRGIPFFDQISSQWLHLVESKQLNTQGSLLLVYRTLSEKRGMS